MSKEQILEAAQKCNNHFPDAGKMVRHAGLEPATLDLENRRSILLS